MTSTDILSGDPALVERRMIIDYIRKTYVKPDGFTYDIMEDLIRAFEKGMHRTEVDRLLLVANQFVGYKENPPNSNKTMFGVWFGLNGVPWCAIFVSYVFYEAGIPLPPIGFPKGMAGCQTAAAFFRANGWLVANPVPGAIVLFDWNKDGRYDHCGIVTSCTSTTQFKTIEGNTSESNQSNGGSVMIKGRNSSNYGTLFALHPVLKAEVNPEKTENNGC